MEWKGPVFLTPNNNSLWTRSIIYGQTGWWYFRIFQALPAEHGSANMISPRSHLIKSDVRTQASTDYCEEIGPLKRYKHVLVPGKRIQYKVQENDGSRPEGSECGHLHWLKITAQQAQGAARAVGWTSCGSVPPLAPSFVWCWLAKAFLCKSTTCCFTGSKLCGIWILQVIQDGHMAS